MNIDFKDLNYTVKKWREREKTILNNISGQFRAGEFTAILGPSGSGKTTLLNILSGYRISRGSGSLGVGNSMPRDERLFRKYSCYIRQDDDHQPLLTVQELMELAASLKLPPNETDKGNRKLIENILSSLGISHTALTRTERLSGGEKKRLSIALELINNPNVFFLDEPTSGLDTVNVTQCLKLLRDLAHSGNRTVICTLHTPTASQFLQFDHVYVLTAGRCVYQGSPQQLVPFLTTLTLQCPISHNPADFVIEVVESSKRNQQLMADATGNGQYSWSTNGRVEVFSKSNQKNISNEKDELNNQGVLTNRARLATSNWNQFVLLFKRMFTQQWRNQVAIRTQLFHHILCMAMFCIVFKGMARDGKEMFNHMKFCVGIVLFHAYTWVMVPVLIYPFEVKLFRREHFNRWYNLLPYYMAVTISRLPIVTILNLIFILPVYYTSGLPMEIHRIAMFFIIGLMTSLTAEGMGLSIGAFFSVTNGSVVGSLLIAPCLGFAVYGFDFAGSIPIFLRFLILLSFMRCGVAALVFSMFGLNRGKLDCSEIYCHFSDPRVILKFVDPNVDPADSSPFFYVGILFLLLLTFRTTSVLALRYRISIK